MQQVAHFHWRRFPNQNGLETTCMETTSQSWLKECRGWRLQLAQSLCLQGLARHRWQRGWFLRAPLIVEETPAALKRIRKQEFDHKMVDEFFSGVCNPESLPAWEHCHSFFGRWSVLNLLTLWCLTSKVESQCELSVFFFGGCRDHCAENDEKFRCEYTHQLQLAHHCRKQENT